MIRRPVFFLFFLVIVFFTCGCSKAPVIVTTDMDRVIRESQQAKRIIDEVESFAKSVEAQLNEAAGQVQTVASDPKSDPARVDYMKAQLNQMYSQAQEEVSLRRNKAEEEVHRKLEETLKVLAKEKGWHLVIRKGPQSALWADEALDQTDLVIKRMDSSFEMKNDPKGM
jgi:Skp family chaperone for outer membrane proteins